MQKNLKAFEEIYVAGQHPRRNNTPLAYTTINTETPDQARNLIHERQQLYRTAPNNTVTKDFPELLKDLFEKYFEQKLLSETRYTIQINQIGANAYSVNLVQGALISNTSPAISNKTIIIVSPTETEKQILNHMNERITELDLRESTEGLHIQNPHSTRLLSNW